MHSVDDGYCKSVSKLACLYLRTAGLRNVKKIGCCAALSDCVMEVPLFKFNVGLDIGLLQQCVRSMCILGPMRRT